VDRRPAGEMEIPHARLLTFVILSLFSGFGLHGTFMQGWAMAGGACQPTGVVTAFEPGPITTAACCRQRYWPLF
jgi:hypothetical protein